METKFYKYFAKESDVEAGFEQTLKLKEKVEGLDQILINSFQLSDQEINDVDLNIWPIFEKRIG